MLRGGLLVPTMIIRKCSHWNELFVSVDTVVVVGDLGTNVDRLLVESRSEILLET